MTDVPYKKKFVHEDGAVFDTEQLVKLHDIKLRLQDQFPTTGLECAEYLVNWTSHRVELMQELLDAFKTV